jgi:hypothetical protein
MSITNELDAAREAIWSYQDQVAQALHGLCPALDSVVRADDSQDVPWLTLWLRHESAETQVSTHEVFGEEGKSLFSDVDDPRMQAVLHSVVKDWSLFCHILHHWMEADLGTELDLTCLPVTAG